MQGSTTYRARWVLPIDRPPIEGGWLEIAGGRISKVGSGPPPSAFQDLGDAALLPALVNAHTHLELSWMAGQVPPSGTMNDWIRTMLRLRRAGPPGGAAAGLQAAREAAELMRATGTVLVGDVSNALTTPAVIREAGLGGRVFHELLGFGAEDPEGMVRMAWDRVQETQTALAETPPPADRFGPLPSIEFSVVAHAPYSVSPQLFVEIGRAAGRALLSIHLAESPEEIEFLRSGHGPIRELLEALGVWTDTWRVPACDPLRYIEELGYLQRGILIVHGVYLTDDDLDRLREAEAVLVTCPRSNVWVGASPPRLSHFYASGVPVAVGTDSLASVASLNLFDELLEMRRLAPEVAAGSLLESATRVGARALGFGREYGTLRVGKRAALLSVDVPPGVTDVEEYLVGGVPASAVRRVA